MNLRLLLRVAAILLVASPAQGQVGPAPPSVPPPSTTGVELTFEGLNINVQPTAATVSRPLAGKLSDQLSVLDFGAACDGTTDDSNAVLAAGQSGRRIIVPGGITCNAPAVAQSSMLGTFLGGGQIRGSDGNPRGPQFGAVRSPPNPQAWDQVNSVQDNCSGGFPCWAKFDYSHALSAEEYHISGPATLGQPVHGYEGMPGTNAHTLVIDNSSGWNQSHNSNDGRTGDSAYNFILQQNGGGDFGVFDAQILCGGTVPAGDGNAPDPQMKTNARGYTDWLAVPGCGFQGGNISALTNAQYLQMQEFHFSDFGNDVSAIGSVMGYNRTSITSPALGNRWIHELATCNLPNQRVANSIACDAAYVVGGQWLIGLDFVGYPGSNDINAVIAMMANQKITLNSTNLDGEGNPSLTNLGGDWITDDGTAIVLAQNDNAVLRLYNPPKAVNGWQFTGSTTGNAVTIGAVGSDAAIPVLLSDKGGAGAITLSNGSIAMRVASQVNSNGYLNVSAGTATAPLTLKDYSLANQDFALSAAGTGLVRLVGTVPATGDASTAVATTAFAQNAAIAAAGAMIGHRYKILNIGGGANLPILVPAGAIDQMIVEIEPNVATILSMALTMPATAVIPDGFIVHFVCTGTITSFTLYGSTGQTVTGAPGNISSTTPVAFMWDSALSNWLPFH